MTIKCECGGRLRPVVFRRFDFTSMAGLPVELRNVSGLRCTKCKGETLEGSVIMHALRQLEQKVLELPRMLLPAEAQFLRKRMHLSQRELAERMHIRRETVASWECNYTQISPQNDYILRGLAASHLSESQRGSAALKTLLAVLGQVQGREKQATAPTQSAPFVLSGQRTARRSAS